jgi:hypothetical protein
LCDVILVAGCPTLDEVDNRDELPDERKCGSQYAH